MHQVFIACRNRYYALDQDKLEEFTKKFNDHPTDNLLRLGCKRLIGRPNSTVQFTVECVDGVCRLKVRS